MMQRFPTRLGQFTLSMVGCDPDRRFAGIKSQLLDREALLDELLSGSSHSQMQDQWKLLDEAWLELRQLLQYDTFAELDAAYAAARAYARRYPKSLRAQEQLARITVLRSVVACDQADIHNNVKLDRSGIVGRPQPN
jgi:hypothetical protein